MKKRIILFILCGAILGGVIGLLIWSNKESETFEKTDYENMKLGSTKKLMIIAHPDDDMLWGGNELIQEDYLVVCITCGSDANRVREFEAVMRETGDKYIMLGYPDKTNGERDNWDSVREKITEDIEKIYALRDDWDMILTHNPEGEYGHIHHKMTNVIVTDSVSLDKLYYFGKYYSKKYLEENDVELNLLSEDILKEKERILNLYQSQDKTIHETFGHTLKAEEIVSYEDWKELYEEE